MTRQPWQLSVPWERRAMRIRKAEKAVHRLRLALEEARRAAAQGDTSRELLSMQIAQQAAMALLAQVDPWGTDVEVDAVDERQGKLF